MLTKDQARAAWLAKLKTSALNAKDAMGCAVYTAEEVAVKLPGLTTHPAAGFTLPYYDVRGKDTGFYRFRYLEQPVQNGFAALTVKKPLRYLQPTGVTPQVYFPRAMNWQAFFKRKPEERWLMITEGELKAACATKLGFPTLALGGVWSFMSKREGIALLEDLATLDLAESVVYIVYDSDAVTNPDVLKAENALARQLLYTMKASPYVIRLPALKGEVKTGLDDYLVAKGGKALEKLITRAEEWEPSAALHELNEEVLFLREGATVLELATRNRWRASDFVSAVYANRTYTAKETKKKETVMVEKRTAQEWIKWAGRAELERMTYVPGGPCVVNGEYNAWRGWGLAAELVKPGNIKPWKELLDFLFDGADPSHRKWFEAWLSYPLQHPGTKLFQAVVMWGLPGTGKTLVGHTMERIYGPNYTEVNERELHGNFNEWAECRQFALGDEITGGDKRAVSDYLKGLVTQKFLRINPKHIKPYTIPDVINWYFTSNHPDAFFIEDEDRRYFVNEVRRAPLSAEFYRQYNDWYKSDAGAGALFYHLLHYDLANFDPLAHAPQTNSKREMISDGRSDVGTWCALLREAPDEVLRLPGGSPPIQRALWTSPELYALYDPMRQSRVTQNGLGRELKRAGFRKVLDGAPLRVKEGLVKLWIVRDIKGLKRPQDFAKLYEKERQLLK